MSLLLEALKKAELAKQMAKAEAPAPESTPAEPAAPLMTREKLPDISQPMEILADDLPTEHAARAAPHERATPAPTAQPRAFGLQPGAQPRKFVLVQVFLSAVRAPHEIEL